MEHTHMKQNELLRELILLANSLFDDELELKKAKHCLDEYQRIVKELDSFKEKIDIPDDILILAIQTVRRALFGDGLIGLFNRVHIGYHVRLQAIKQQTAQ